MGFKVIYRSKWPVNSKDIIDAYNVSKKTQYIDKKCHPDITVMVDWVLKINYLSIFW